MHFYKQILIKNTVISLGSFSFLKTKKVLALKERMTLTMISFVFLLFFLLPSLAQSTHSDQDHTHHEHEHVSRSSDQMSKQTKLITGQGAFVFSWDKELTAAFPKDAQKFEPKMHGGFNEDPETGIVYTGIPGYGLCSISPNLTKWKILGIDKRLKDNIHGIVFFVHKGKKYLAVTQEGKRVLVLTLDGKVVSEILKPSGNEFKFAIANEFFSEKDSNFGVTDITYLKGKLYVAHGYSKGDFVITIKEKGGVWSWGKLAWGGKGDKPGQFKTAHGIYTHNNQILVANRAAGQVVKFTKKGKFVEIFEDIPKGSLICNVSYNTEHYFLNALSAIDKQKSAPIYVHTGEKLVSTVISGDLNIPTLSNIHQVWPHFVKAEDGSKQLYLLVHGWNKGKFAVLKHEK